MPVQMHDTKDKMFRTESAWLGKVGGRRDIKSQLQKREETIWVWSTVLNVFLVKKVN